MMTIELVLTIVAAAAYFAFSVSVRKETELMRLQAEVLAERSLRPPPDPPNRTNPEDFAISADVFLNAIPECRVLNEGQ